ncbi:hypothetical protein [Tenacibaculum insulae]|uniref:hypothetical protein n=1 Tax=Tenacibaculum insulae TaxID=2029677 RepID=UPI003AB3CB7D
MSCEDKASEDIPIEQESILLLSASLENGKFNFNSKEDLASKIDLFKKQSKETKENYFEDFYEKGFIPLEPIVNPKNTYLLEKINSKKKLRNKNSNFIDISTLIGDKNFAAFINDEGEIIVENSLYKFTPKGLFFGDLKDSTKIRNTAFKTYKRASKLAMPICELRETEGGIRQMEPDVFRYIAPIDEYGCGEGSYGGGSGYTGGTTSTKGDPKTDRAALFEIIKNLDIVTNPGDNWFQNIFGTYRYAHKYFSNRDYRFELDYHNQSYLVYRSLGIEAETHKEGWFWWNNVDSDEIILGVNKIHAVLYDLPKPKIETLTLNEVFPNSNPREPIYIHNDSFKIENNGVFEPVSIKVLANKGVPYFKYNDDAILNIYVGEVLGYTVDKEINYNVLSDSNIRAIYKLGVDYFKKQANSQREDFFVTVQKSSKEIDLLYFNEFKRKYNTDEVQRNIVSEFAGQISAEVIDGELKTDWVKTVGDLLTGKNFVGKYRFKELDFYGIARRGNEWRGLQIKKKEN